MNSPLHIDQGQDTLVWSCDDPFICLRNLWIAPHILATGRLPLCDNPVDNIPTQLYILLYRQNTLHHHIHIMMEHILHVEYLYQFCQLPIFMPNYGSSCYDQLCHDLWRESLRSTAAHWVSINHSSIITPGGWPDDFVNDYILQTLLQCNFEPKLFVDT